MQLPKIVKLAECSQLERELLLKRSEVGADSVLLRVTKIISDVRSGGDRALLDYTERFDGVRLDRESIKVGEEEFTLARNQLEPKVTGAIEHLARAIERFHKRQLPVEWEIELTPGIKAKQLVRAIESVGIYVPGGLAKYPSTLLMAAVPARVAGVARVIVCTPPTRDGKIAPAILIAAQIAGVAEVFKVGGAQAIAAMAYGTETVPKVDKIVGPGNVYVAAAKQVVAPHVDIDFTAGPSEILIIADDSANPELVAADLIAQSEHDVDAAAILVTTSESLARKVRRVMRGMMKESPRRDIVLRALTTYGRIVVVKDMDDAVDFANAYAPEHLQLMVKRPKRLLGGIRNAGSIFVGNYSPVAAGDLAVGVNHILPTGGAARRKSGLSVFDFLKFPTVQELSKSGLKRVAETVRILAEVEGLPGHALSVKKRTGGPG
jgi:histidinol dehydrogenase